MVYVDDAFVEGSWGKWSGGGHLQADTEKELHEFARKLGLKRSWFQDRPERPEYSHYDLTAGMRQKAIRMGAVQETFRESVQRTRSGTERRRAAQAARNESTQNSG